jgi:hypothetical protein
MEISAIIFRIPELLACLGRFRTAGTGRAAIRYGGRGLFAASLRRSGPWRPVSLHHGPWIASFLAMTELLRMG